MLIESGRVDAPEGKVYINTSQIDLLRPDGSNTRVYVGTVELVVRGDIQKTSNPINSLLSR